MINAQRQILCPLSFRSSESSGKRAETNSLVVTLSNLTPKERLTMDTVVDSLLNEEARRKERGMVVQFEANIVENHGRSASRSRDKS